MFKHELFVALSDVLSQFLLLKLTGVVSSSGMKILQKTHELYFPHV